MSTTVNSGTLPRSVNRGANPFAPIVLQQNRRLTPNNAQSIYVPLTQRAAQANANPKVQKAVAELKARLAGQTYTQEHFGELLLVPAREIDINVEIQRDAEAEHQADILERFDPRIIMPVMCTKLANGRYSAWEGQQSSCIIFHLMQAGLVSPEHLIQIKAFDEDMEVPGSDLKGEAVGNYGFRQINGGMRKPIDAFHLHRSRVNGVRLYNSEFTEDKQSEEIQQILENNSMFPAKASAAQRNQATPGMVTYLHGCNLIAGHGTEQKVFDLAKQDLDWALAWHNRYYPNEKGVDGGFILAFGRLHHAARTSKPAIKLDAAIENDLFDMFKTLYGSPKAFHRDCKQRLETFQYQNNLNKSWSDSCLTPILVLDYLDSKKYAGKLNMPVVPGMNLYAGI